MAKFEDLIKILKQIKLTDSEKNHSRGGLLKFMADHSVRTHKLSPVPRGRFFRLMPASLIIALLVGGGVSFAAEQSLPGDILFPVKVSLNENIKTALALNAESKAKIQSALAQKRLEEAEKLAVQGRLNEATKTEIELNFANRANKVKKIVTDLEAKGNIDLAAKISSNFETALKAHQSILISLGNQKNIDEWIHPIVVTVKNHSDNIAQSRIKAESALRASTETNIVSNAMPVIGEGRGSAQVEIKVKNDEKASNQFRRAAENVRVTARRKIQEVRTFIERQKKRLSAEAVTKAEARLKIAENIIVEGNTRLEAKVWGEAFVLFQQAHRLAQEAKLLLEAAKNFNIEVEGDGQVEVEINQEIKASRQYIETQLRSKIESIKPINPMPK